MTALRAAAAAFKQDGRMRQLHSGSLRLAKRKREMGEQVDMGGLKLPEKVLCIVHGMFKSCLSSHDSVFITCCGTISFLEAFLFSYLFLDSTA